MKITDKEQLHKFLSVVDQCNGEVRLESVYGDCYNLKSELSEYIAIGALLRDKAQDLELFCSSQDDELLFLKFFHENPEVLG